jgi:flagellar motility protein MotE (MotC chaperone)
VTYELGVIACLIIFMFYQAWYFRSWEKQERDRYSEQIGKLEYVHKEEREAWTNERQQLLDRIQSPTFAEYKHQEVKVIKAKNGTDKPDVVIEQL